VTQYWKQTKEGKKEEKECDSFDSVLQLSSYKYTPQSYVILARKHLCWLYREKLD
jgi:hypothetical protein